jgi:hypothetical protein
VKPWTPTWWPPASGASLRGLLQDPVQGRGRMRGDLWKVVGVVDDAGKILVIVKKRRDEGSSEYAYDVLTQAAADLDQVRPDGMHRRERR